MSLIPNCPYIKVLVLLTNYIIDVINIKNQEMISICDVKLVNKTIRPVKKGQVKNSYKKDHKKYQKPIEKAHPLVRSFILKDFTEYSFNQDMQQQDYGKLLQRCMQKKAFSLQKKVANQVKTSFRNIMLQQSFTRRQKTITSKSAIKKNMIEQQGKRAYSAKFSSSRDHNTLSNSKSANNKGRLKQKQEDHQFFLRIVKKPSTERTNTVTLKNPYLSRKNYFKKIQKSTKTQSKSLKQTLFMGQSPMKATQNEEQKNFQSLGFKILERSHMTKRILSRKLMSGICSPLKNAFRQQDINMISYVNENEGNLEQQQEESSTFYLKTINY